MYFGFVLVHTNYLI